MLHPEYSPQRHNQQRPAPSPSPFGLTGQRLLDRGWCPVPIKPGTKRPAVDRWADLTVEALTGDKRHSFAAWCRSPYGIGLLCGAGVVALDLDIDDPAAIALITSLPGLNVSKTGAKGITRFFRYDPADPILSRKLAGCLDVLSTGRQTVLPPSIHPGTGRPYHYVGDHHLDQVELDDLPLITSADIEALGQALALLGYVAPATDRKPRSEHPAGEGGGSGLWAEVNRRARLDLDWIHDLSLANLEPKRGGGWRATARWRAGGTGRGLHDRKRNLHLDDRGIVDWGDGERHYSPIDLVAAALPCSADAALMWLLARVGPDLPPFDPPGNRRRREQGGAAAAAPPPAEFEVPVSSLEVGVTGSGDSPISEAERLVRQDKVRDDTAKFVRAADSHRANIRTSREATNALAEIKRLYNTDRRGEAQSLADETYGNLQVYVADAQAGLGKTDAIIKNLDRFLYLSQTLELSEEVSTKSGAVRIAAQSSSHPVNGIPNCTKYPSGKVLEHMRKAGGSQESLCTGCSYAAPDALKPCPFVSSRRAIEAGPPRIAGTHSILVQGGVALGDRLAVIDEMPHATLIGQIDQNAPPLYVGELVPAVDSDPDYKRPTEGDTETQPPHRWHALEAIKDAIERWHIDCRKQGEIDESGRIIPAAIFLHIGGEELDTDRAELARRGDRRLKKAIGTLNHQGSAGIGRLAAKVDGEARRDSQRLAILDAIVSLDLGNAWVSPALSSHLALDLDSRKKRHIGDTPIHSIKLRPLAQEIAESGVVLLLTATPPDDDALRAMFRTETRIEVAEDVFVNVDVEPMIHRQEAEYVPRPAQNRIILVPGGNPSSAKIDEKAADLVSLINFLAEGKAEPMPVATTKAKGEALKGLQNVETRTHAKMIGVNRFKDREGIVVLGDQRRPPAASEIEIASLTGLIPQEVRWVEEQEPQTMTHGNKEIVGVKLPRMVEGKYNWPGLSPRSLPAPLAGLAAMIERNERWHAQMDLIQAVERIRLLHPLDDGSPKVGTIIADMVLPFPVDAVAPFSHAKLPQLKLEKLRTGIGVIPSSPAWAQAIGNKDEIGDHAWRERVENWAVLSSADVYRVYSSEIGVQYVWRCRVSGTRGGRWTTCISFDPPAFAMPRLAKVLKLTLQLNPEDKTLMATIMPTGSRLLLELGFAKSESHAKTITETIDGHPLVGYRRISVKTLLRYSVARSAEWIVSDTIADPTTSIRLLLAERNPLRTLVEIKELPQPVE